jgi:serine/threonine kinase PknH
MADELKAGDRLGDFEILSVAGAGGMGVVYKARQQSLDRDVALKVIREEIAGEPEYRERFIREAKLAASVDHPHVVTVYDVGDEDGRLYLVMQWIDGIDLRELLRKSGRLPPQRGVEIGTQLAGAIDAVHAVSGLVHRDVKPANVLVREVGGEEHAYLTDFGIAKPADVGDTLTRTGSTVGTTGYLSPEQIQGREAGPRSDLYSLGCLVFEMLTGQTPFGGENELAVRWAHASDSRPLASRVLPSLGDRYDGFFLTALAIDPTRRFASGRDFAGSLAKAQSGDGEDDPTAVMTQTHAATKVGPVSPPPPGVGYQGGRHTPPPYGYVTPPPQPQDRSGSPLALILLAIVAVVGIAVAALAAAGVFSQSSGSPSSRTVASAGNSSTKKKGTSRPQKKKSLESQLPPNSSPCSKGLWVNSDTTCPFAENTRSAYAEANGAEKIQVYSPVTGLTYEMTCTGSPLVTCTGGDHAAVHFSSAHASGQNTSPPPTPEPTPEPTTSAPPSTSGLTPCDSNISVNEVTTCPFAENVFEAYAEEYESFGKETFTYVDAFSSATNESYEMECVLESDVVSCSGGTEAFVTFPMQAVREY